jgi:hypothetical protein
MLITHHANLHKLRFSRSRPPISAENAAFSQAYGYRHRDFADSSRILSIPPAACPARNKNLHP